LKAPSARFNLLGDERQEILMLLPLLIGFCLFVIYPILWVLRWALFEYNSIGRIKFIWFENFIRAFTRDPSYWKSLGNIFVITAAKLVLEIPFALLLAVLVNQSIKGRHIFRTLFFLPTIFSVAVVGMIFTILFSGYNGIINEFLIQGRIIREAVIWFGSKWTAMFVILMVSLWTTFGLNMIYFLMGLQNVPKELYECSMIDGATPARQFFFITIPMLGPVLQVILMLSMLGTMRMTDLVLVMTNGQPGGSTEVVMTYIFKYFFQYNDFNAVAQYGYASALSIITALFLSVLTLVYLRVSRSLKELY
jgi:raffinose/stachyose/melibiose transport system permease protein